MKPLALFCALTAPALVAANEVGHWYVTPQIGGISADRDRPVEDEDWLYGLVIGKHVSEHASLELNLTGAKLDNVPAPGDLNLYSGSLDLLGVMNRSGNVSPYVSFGLGALRNERSGPGSDATDFMSQAGVGLLMTAWRSADGSRSFALRPDIKARWSEAGAQGDLVDYVATLGFQFSFGPKPAPRAVEPPPPPPSPPPAPEPEPTPPPPPADSDNDGVIDEKDKCPGTPSGVAVDADGCPQRGSITLEGVTFELNSATLTAESRRILDGLAENLQKYPRLRIELQGHTDSTGSDQYNLKLSEQRANAVREYLLSRGVPSFQLTAKGYGESQPIDDNSTPEGRARNRRVVMYVLENPGDVKVEGEGSVER